MSLLSELKRRNVFRVALGYLAGAWLLIQVVETLLPIFGVADDVIRIIVILLFIGFPLVIVLSWMYELTPEGLKLERDVDRSKSITHRTGKRLDRAIVIVLVAAVGYFAFDKFVISPQQARQLTETAREEGRTQALAELYGGKSIVVLPFLDMSAAGDQEYLSDGLAEELLNILAKIRELRVISRTSAFSYKNKEVKIADVASELKVNHVLEGSVRKSGDRLRITVQLIHAPTDTHLWSETYDRALDDIFLVQDDVAEKVAEKLKVTLLEQVPSADVVNAEAYALLLQANHLRRHSTPESFEKAVELYLEALEIDPDYAVAWDRLAILYCMQANFGLRDIDEGYELCRETTNKALQIDPNYAPAHSGLGWIAMQKDGDFAAAAKHYERALQLDPTSVAIIADAAVLVQYLGRLQESIRMTEYAMARDPVNPQGRANLGLRYRYADRIQDAIDAFRSSISLSPDRIGAHYQLGVALLRNGDAQGALEAFEKEQSDDWRVMGAALANHALGNEPAYEAALKELIDGWGEQWPTQVAQTYAWVGDVDRAFEWLEKSRQAHGEGSWPSIGTDDLLHKLYDDPRWPEYRDTLGVSAADVAGIEFTVELPEQPQP